MVVESDAAFSENELRIDGISDLLTNENSNFGTMTLRTLFGNTCLTGSSA